jgi:hypothetical protein
MALADVKRHMKSLWRFTSGFSKNLASVFYFKIEFICCNEKIKTGKLFK